MQSYQSHIVANHILRYANNKHKKSIHYSLLIVLMYHMHGWYLLIKGFPLLEEEFQKHYHEPVLPTLTYNPEVHKNGRNHITTYIKGHMVPFSNTMFDKQLEEDGDFILFLEKVWEYVFLQGLGREIWCAKSSANQMTQSGKNISNLTIRLTFRDLAKRHQGLHAYNRQPLKLIPVSHEHILPGQRSKDSC